MSPLSVTRTCGVLLALAALGAACRPAPAAPAAPLTATAGTWAATASASDYLETPLLLTDGTVIIHSYGSYTTWFKLTPDAQGNYADGVITQIASNALGRLYGQTAVLRDGRVFYGGGEYLSGTSDHNTCEVYDPVANTWTAGPDSLYNALGDTGSAILPDGRLLCSNWSNYNTDIYDPVTNSWANAAPMTTSTGDEESWTSLADGTILSTFRIGQRYLPSQNAWQPTGSIPVSLVDSASEIGPTLELYDGRVLSLGATGHTAFFTLPATQSGAGSWTAGPDMPAGLSAPDTPACVEVNGKVLCVGTPTDFGDTNFLEFDPVANTFSPVPSPTGFSQVSDGVRLLALPDGQILMTASYQNAWVYTPVGGPQPGWAPTVTAVAANADGSYTVSGTQLNGLTNGAAYGDEANPYTHYPLVSLVDGAGAVHFARTFNFSQMNPSLPGAAQTADFTLPPGLASGAYSLYVTASGVPSAPFSFQVGGSVAATTLTVANAAGLVGQTITLSATLKEAGGAALSGQTLTFSVDGTPVGTAVTNAGGTAGLPYVVPSSLQSGVHALTAAFAGDATDAAASGAGTLTVSKADTLLFLSAVSGAPGQTVTLKATLKRKTGGTPVAGAYVSFSVDGGQGGGTGGPDGGQSGGAYTNAAGLAALPYTIPAGDVIGSSHPLVATFYGNDTLNGSSSTGALTVSKYSVTLSVSALSGVPGQTVTLTATLKRGGVTALAGENVTFTVDGAAAGSAVTNSSGVAALPFTIPAGANLGSHSIVATFAGDGSDSAATGKGTLTVKNATALSVANVSGAHGTSVTLSAVLTAGGAAAAGKTVTFKVDGKAVGSAVTDGTGTAGLPYAIPATSKVGGHPISASFAADGTDNAATGAGTLTTS